MQTLSIDIETWSSVNLLTSGVYKYVLAKDFEILMLAYSIDNTPVKIIDLAAGEKLPGELRAMLKSPDVIKKAYNAQFERVALSKYLGATLDPAQWECSMVRAAMASLPMGLDKTAAALNLDIRKDKAGWGLISYFCIPCKPTAKNGLRERNFYNEAPEKWEAFKRYCIRDVEVEQKIDERLQQLPIFTKFEHKIYALDQIINSRGVKVDMQLVKNAVSMDMAFREKALNRARELTGIENPNSGAQLKKWLTEEMDEEVLTLRKDDVPGLLKKASNDVIREVLELRQALGKSSVSKYAKMGLAAAKDHRVRALLQYYGASRTGRWAGRLVQVQNLPRNTIEDLDLARDLVLENDADTLEMLFGNIPAVLSQLIRTAFVPEEGHRFITSDYKAIEARVIAWLAGEKWRLKVFATHGEIYEASYAQMYNVPIEKVTSDQRQQGKVAELALGYQGGVNALTTMDTKKALKEEQKQPIVNAWRNANPSIVRLWYTVQNLALDVIKNGGSRNLTERIKFSFEKGIFYIHLPSGRRLVYLRARTVQNRFGGESIAYEGQNQTTGKWELQETYGGKLVENIVQAIARDLLADAMLRLEAAGYVIVMHVHDEVVLEVPEWDGSTEEVTAIMSAPVRWAEGLPLAAKTTEMFYYQKD